MSMSKSTHALPVRLDSMVGRREEMSLIRRLLSSTTRLVTVTGAAGIGKSRIAIATAGSVARSVSGVWYIDVRNAGRSVAMAIAHELKVDPLDDALGAVIGALGDSDALLLLDDIDGAIAETSAVVDAVLVACPAVRLIVTGREQLTSTAQAIVTIGPLEHRRLDPASETVRLFAERAASGDAHFTVDDGSLPDVARICEATRGVPLAVELAAAQLQFMDVHTLASRMDRQLHSLEPAHAARSLRDAVEDSWRGCTPVERRVWSDLAVLAPGWDLALGEAMAALDAGSPAEASRVVKQLIRRSIVHRRRVEGGVRYELLPALREYGAEQAEHRTTAERCFVESMAERLHDAEDHWFSGRQREILSRLRGDIPNIRLAVQTAAAAQDADRAVEVAVTAWRPVCHLHGSLDELGVWLGLALTAGTPSPYWAVLGHAIRAWLFGQTGKPGLARQELTLAEDASEAFARSSDDPRAVRECAAAVHSAAETLEADDAEAVRGLRRLMEELGEEAFRFGRTNIPERLAARLHVQGSRTEGRAVDAAIIERGLVAGDRFERSFVLTVRATAEATAGEFADVERDARDALVLKRGLGNGLGVAHALELLADLAREHADPSRGATLLGAAAGRWADAGALHANYPPYFYDRAPTERALRYRLGDEAFDKAFAYGAALSEDESIDFALHGVVEAHVRAGVPVMSRRSVLTPRESQVASLVSDGATNKAIARQLFVSIRTVESHVQNALVKLGLHSRTELAIWYREHASR